MTADSNGCFRRQKRIFDTASRALLVPPVDGCYHSSLFGFIVKPRFGCVLLTACLLGVFGGVANSQGVEGKPVAKVSTQAGPVAAKFDKLEIKTSAVAGVGVVDLYYDFTNTSDFPLAIEGFVQSCGCMVGEWDGTPVKPGERGRIKAKFLTQGLRGLVRKHLTVKFFESDSVELFAEVNIPETLVYSAQTLHWTVGESPKSKQVDIDVNEKTSLRVLSVTVNDPSFSCELQTITESRKYRILITPNDTQAERVCVLQVRTDAKDPRDALQGLFALVEKPKLAGGAR